jgi:hypothetical protein
MKYRRQLKTGFIKTYEHVKAEEEKRLSEVYTNTKMSKLCREENLRKVSFKHTYHFPTFPVLNFHCNSFIS